ncbi:MULTISPECIES: hypothetical protein [unclassified Oceanobacillus]|uniref:hypothetical protein n=1 Tax=unclassified Oceanobacillus TaxID=2630292 RepID=UPI0012EB792F|nr:hypothetical protein [Oceanobacillus sp. AG]
MRTNVTIYEIVVHAVNWLLLGLVGFVAFGLLINISEPGPVPNFGIIDFLYLIFLLAMWGLNYRLQLKIRKWYLPLVGTILFITIGLVVLGVVVPFLNHMIYL